MRGLSGMVDTLWPLPEGWEWVALGNPNLVEIVMGQSPPSKTYNTMDQGLPFFQGKAEFGDLYPSPVKWCSSPTKIGLIGDVLISVRAPVGPTNLVKEECCIGRGLAGLRPKGNLETFYLLYCLRCLETQISGKGRGSAFNSISKTDIAQFKIPIPYPNNPKLSLDIQQRTVARIESLLGEIKRNRLLLEQMRLDNDLLLPNALNEVVEKLEYHYQLESLQQYIVHLTSGSRDWGKYANINNEGSLFIKGANVQFAKLDLTNIEKLNLPSNITEERAKVQPNDVLVTITGTIGRCCIVTDNIGDAYVNRHTALIRLKEKLDPYYLMWFILTPLGGEKQTKMMQYGQVKPGLNLTNIRNLRLPVPDISIQKQIVSHIDAIQQEVNKINTIIEEDEQNFNYLEQAILEKAFRGEL
jgi:type I restriction enzyme S subunit